MRKEMTRARLIQIWFALVVLVLVAGFALGTRMTVATGAAVLVLCLVPPAITLLLWPGVQPPTAGDVIRGNRRD